MKKNKTTLNSSDYSTNNLKIEQIESDFKSIFQIFESIRETLEDSEKNSTAFSSLKETFSEKKAVLKSFEDKKYYIAFIGPYSVGKSTFINALLERDILPEKLEIATTAFPTYLISASSDNDEKAEIYYASDNQRRQLKDFYILQITDNIKKEYHEAINLRELAVDDLKDALYEIEKKLEVELVAYNKKLFSLLYSLIDKWDVKVDVKEDLEVDAVKDFVESNEYSIIISQAKVYLNTPILSANNDIVLVDLPGVDADNKRHYKITYDFTITDAHAQAYIVVTSPDKIDTENTNIFLRSLAQNTKQISKAFWVINKSDQSEDLQETKKSLAKKISESAISINYDRVYTISALKYKEQGAEKNSEYLEIISSVDKLRKNLISYLSDNFVNEFIDTKIDELSKLKLKLIEFVEPKVGKYIDLPENQAEKLFEIEYIEQKVSEEITSLYERVKLVFQAIEEKLNSLDFFNVNTIDLLKRRVEKELEGLDAQSKCIELDAERDSSIKRPEDFIRLVEGKIKLNEYIREAFSSALNDESEIALLLKMPFTLMNEDFIKDRLSLIKHNNSLGGRFNGVCDIILMGYSKIFSDVLELTLDNSINRTRAKIVTSKPNMLFQTIKIPTSIEGTNVREILLKDLILNKYTEEFKFDKILEQLGLNYEYNDKEFSLYKKRLVLLIVENYLNTISKNVNTYIKLCMNNHLKEINSYIKQFTHSKEFENKIRLHFKLLLEENIDLSFKVNNTRLFYISIYNKLKNAYFVNNE
jgi:GTPase Era involved in 16S rRNA processing